jgi:hypothetical protein
MESAQAFWLNTYDDEVLEQAKAARKFVLLDVFNPG